MIVFFVVISVFILVMCTLLGWFGSWNSCITLGFAVRAVGAIGSLIEVYLRHHTVDPSDYISWVGTATILTGLGWMAAHKLYKKGNKHVASNH